VHLVALYCKNEVALHLTSSYDAEMALSGKAFTLSFLMESAELVLTDKGREIQHSHTHSMTILHIDFPSSREDRERTA
jgi:hypothetical protein